MIRNGYSSSGERMIKNIMTSCRMIEQEAILFQELNEFARSKARRLRHVTTFLLLNSDSLVRLR